MKGLCRYRQLVGDSDNGKLLAPAEFALLEVASRIFQIELHFSDSEYVCLLNCNFEVGFTNQYPPRYLVFAAQLLSREPRVFSRLDYWQMLSLSWSVLIVSS